MAGLPKNDVNNPFPVRGGGEKITSLRAPSLPAKDLTDEEEKRLRDLSAEQNFINRDPVSGRDALGSKGQGGLQSLIPAAVKKSESEDVPSKDELRAQYLNLLAKGKPLPMPEKLLTAHGLPRHRFYHMMPVHVAAALEALTEANGYEKEWMLIAEMMRALGAFEGAKD